MKEPAFIFKVFDKLTVFYDQWKNKKYLLHHEYKTEDG